MKVIVYGASDDLIEVEGDIRKEWSNPSYSDEPRYLAFGDGSVLRVAYTEGGLWRVERVREGSATFSVERATDPDSDFYSDHATLEGDLRRVRLFASQKAAEAEAAR